MSTTTAQRNKSTRTTPVKSPRGLSPGDQVALVAPAFTFDPEVFAKGRAFIESHYGLKTVFLENVTARDSFYFAGDDARREDELFHWLTDPDTAGVIAIRGGYGCSRIYPSLIRRLKAQSRKLKQLKPKILVGYSDLTILLNGLFQDLGWLTFHGPAVAGKPFREPLPIEEDSFRRSVFERKPLGLIEHPELHAFAPGEAQGRIVGGNLSLVVASLGTPYEIDSDNKILFLEDVDERPFRIDRMLTQLVHAGKLDRVKGIVLGEFTLCDPPTNSRDPNQTTYTQAIHLALDQLVKKRGIPVIAGFPAGHGSPQLTFPIGARVRVAATAKGRAQVEFLE